MELEKEHDYTICTCSECIIIRAIFINIDKILNKSIVTLLSLAYPFFPKL